MKTSSKIISGALFLFVCFWLVFGLRYQRLAMIYGKDAGQVKARFEVGQHTMLLDLSRVETVANRDKRLAFVCRACAWIELGEFAKAEQDIHAARRVSGGLTPVNTVMIAHAYDRMLDTERAHRIFLLGRSDNPDNLGLLFDHARFLNEQAFDGYAKGPQQAVAIFADAIALYNKQARSGETPSVPMWRIREALSQTYLQMKQYDQAVNQAEYALVLASALPEKTVQERRYKRKILSDLQVLLDDCQDTED